MPWPLRFGLLAAVWGLSFLFIKVGDEALAPAQVALGRMACGTAALVLVCIARRQRFQAGWRTWAHLLVAAALLNAAPYTLYAYGELRVPSVLAGIYNAATPLFTLPVAVVMIPTEKLTAGRLVGMIVGFAGVVVVLGAWRGLGGGDVRGNLLCLAAAGCYGLGFPYARRFLTALGRATCARDRAAPLRDLGVAAVAPLISGAPAELPGRVVGSVVALGVVGTGLAYVLNFSVIRDAGAVVASTVTYVIPIFSTLAGVVLLGEPLAWNEPVGAAVIIVGALATQSRIRLSRAPLKYAAAPTGGALPLAAVPPDRGGCDIKTPEPDDDG